MELNRTMEQWRGCDPEAMAYHMSEAATMYAFKDAKADILALHAENERLRAQAQHESDCAEAYKTEADRLRDENARLRAALEQIGDTACGEASHQYIALQALAAMQKGG